MILNCLTTFKNYISKFIQFQTKCKAPSAPPKKKFIFAYPSHFFHFPLSPFPFPNCAVPYSSRSEPPAVPNRNPIGTSVLNRFHRASWPNRCTVKHHLCIVTQTTARSRDSSPKPPWNTISAPCIPAAIVLVKPNRSRDPMVLVKHHLCLSPSLSLYIFTSVSSSSSKR